MKCEITLIFLDYCHIAVFLQTTINGREVRWDAEADERIVKKMIIPPVPVGPGVAHPGRKRA